MTLTKRWRAALDDEGVSPVIAVILMVAITVVLAATVYVWVSGFATEDTGPEQASATANGVDLDDNGDVEWIQVTLTKGENAPYQDDDITYSVTAPSGSAVTTVYDNATATTANEFDGGNEWDVGQTIWIDCKAEGNHLITFSVSGTAILDTTVSCGESEA